MTFGILALGFPVSEGVQVSQVLQPLGAHSLTFFPILPYLNAFLRWRLASWLWGSLFRRVLQSLGAHSLTFFPILPYLNAFLRWRLASWLWGSLFLFPILMHSLGDVWHPGSGVRLASWLWGSLFRRFCLLQVSQVLQPLGAHSPTFFPIIGNAVGVSFSRLVQPRSTPCIPRGTPTAVARFLTLGVGGRGGSP